MLNLVIVQGNLVRDPEEKNGCVWFTIAANHKYKNKQEEWIEETSFIRAITGGGTGKAVMQFLKKGAQAIVYGRLKTEQIEGEKGSRVTIVANQVIFVGKTVASEEASSEKPNVEWKE